MYKLAALVTMWLALFPAWSPQNDDVADVTNVAACRRQIRKCSARRSSTWNEKRRTPFS